MLGQVKPENIGEYLSKIDRIFPSFCEKATDSVLEIEAYYDQSFWGYAIFHSWSGAIHMALSKNGKFTKNDYFAQAEEIADLIRSEKSRGRNILRVLEVGSGRGFNLNFLSQEFKEIEFFGVDISSKNVRYAKRLNQDNSNCDVEIGDFHDLTKFDPEYFDLVFGVETICHALTLEAVLASITHVIRKDGLFAVFDGFRNNFGGLGSLLQKAVVYTERSMAVPKFHETSVFIAETGSLGLTLVESVDRSDDAMPNLIRLSDLAKAFFKVPAIAKLIAKLLPDGLVKNAVAGLLMSVTVHTRAHRYLKMTLRKA